MEGYDDEFDFQECSQRPTRKPELVSPAAAAAVSKPKFDGSRVEADPNMFKPSWEFLSEAGKGVMVTNEIVARPHVEGPTRFLYFARKNSFGSLTFLKFSMFTASRIKALLDEIMEQVEVSGENPDLKLLPFFHGSYKRAYAIPSKRSAESYWDSPDYDYGSIKVRLGFDTREGKYVLRILSPVETPLFQNWHGPVLLFNSSEMKGLREFIASHIVQN